MKYPRQYPEWVFDIWVYAMADLHSAKDDFIPAHPVRRLWWKIRGEVLAFLFGWWWWK